MQLYKVELKHTFISEKETYYYLALDFKQLSSVLIEKHIIFNIELISLDNTGYDLPILLDCSIINLMNDKKDNK